MNNRLMIQRLWWKELRQLLPMLILLPTIAFLLTALYLLNDNSNQFNWSAGVAVFLGMPGLFAVGAGALLVGQEKEMRTIQWLASLPIRPQTIVRIKTAAAVVGLAILWVISGLYFLWRDRYDTPMTDIGQFSVWPTNSFFVLFAGIAIAWRIKSALVALLLVVPIAMVPYVLALVLHAMMAADEYYYTDPSPGTVIAMQVIGCLVALFLVDRFGRAALSPERVRLGLPFLANATNRERNGRAAPASYGVIQSPLPALIWQFAMQSRALLIGTSIMLLVAAAMLLMRYASRANSVIPFDIFLCYLATSWLGASVFQSDSAHQRIRFLADRGLSPRLIWLTRQIVPITVIAAIAIATLLLASLVGPAGLKASPGLGTMGMLAIASLFVVFSFSQWAGQVITSPIVSMVVAPLVSIIPFTAYSFSVVTLGSPLGLISIAAFLPFLATFLSTRRWMDRRFGKRYWFTQGGYAAIVILMPTFPHFMALAFEPGMSRQVRKQIETVVANPNNVLRMPVELVLDKDVENERPFVSFVRTWNNQIDSVRSQFRATSAPIGISSQGPILKILAINLMAGMSLQQSDSAVSDEHLDLFRRSMELLSDMVVRMRTSPQVVDQDFADSIEIAMVRQMRRTETRAALGEERYKLVAARLADTQARRDARVRSVALSWYNYDSQSKFSRVPPSQFGGYDLQGGGDGLSWKNGKGLAHRRVARRAENLWRMADFSGDEVPKEWLLEVASDWGIVSTYYGLGSGGIYYRVDSVDDSIAVAKKGSNAIANQWYAGWEKQARELLYPSN